MECGGLFDGFFEVGIAVGTQWTPLSCPSLVLVSEVRDCARRTSRTKRARVGLACVWVRLLKLWKTATSQGSKYEVLCGGMKRSDDPRHVPQENGGLADLWYIDDGDQYWYYLTYKRLTQPTLNLEQNEAH